MKIEDIIRARHSVRNYLDKKIEDDKVDVLSELIDKYNTEGNLNIQMVLNNGDAFDKFILHYGRIKNCKNYIALIGRKDESNVEEKVGYYGEHLVLKAQELGLNTCWVAGTYSKSAVVANIAKDEKLYCIIALGYGDTNGNIRKSKSPEEVANIENSPEWFKRGVEFALLAPTAINQQKFKLEYIDDDNVKASAPNSRMAKIDLGIVKYHFELGADKKFDWK